MLCRVSVVLVVLVCYGDSISAELTLGKAEELLVESVSFEKDLTDVLRQIVDAESAERSLEKLRAIAVRKKAFEDRMKKDYPNPREEVFNSALRKQEQNIFPVMNAFNEERGRVARKFPDLWPAIYQAIYGKPYVAPSR